MNNSVQTLGVFLTAFGAFIGTLVLAYRGLSGDRFTRKVSESAALLSGYTEMVKNLRVEIGEIRIDHDKEILRNKDQYHQDLERLSAMHKLEINNVIAMYNEERKQWAIERERTHSQMLALEERLEELKTQVYLLNNPTIKTLGLESEKPDEQH